jgi:SRSO17 transposase
MEESECKIIKKLLKEKQKTKEKKKHQKKVSKRRWPFEKWTFINVQNPEMNFWMSIIF